MPKLENVKRVIPQIGMTIDDFVEDASENDLARMYNLISNHKEKLQFFGMVKRKGRREYHTIVQKMCTQVSQRIFEQMKRQNWESLQIHTIWQISQFRHTKETKEVVSNPETILYQTKQEKSQYCIPVSKFVNLGVLYESSGTTSHGTISDVKSHKTLST